MTVQEVQKIINMIYHFGRPLEEVRVRHLFFGGSVEDVLTQLSFFQNEDGGFGYALEPDAWNPESTPIQTWTATTIIKELDVDKKHPMIEKIVAYLEKSLDLKTMRWPLVVPSNDDYPHAIWWSYRDEIPGWNPTASLAGFLIKYAHPLSFGFKQATLIAKEAFQFITETEEPIEMHELRTLIDLMIDSATLFGRFEGYLKAKDAILKHIERILEHDSNQWFTSYCVKPSALIKDHPTFVSEAFLDLLKLEFDLAVKNRNDMGIWDATWSWGTDYPSEEAESKNIWKAIIAFDYLLLMIKTGYLEVATKA